MLDDKYRIERLLAVGGMGAVYVGTHIKLRKRVAIKVLNPQLSSAPMIERFHREAITASQIGHEGIAQVTDLGTSRDGEPFLVMEYLEGESLASRLRASGPLPIEDACELGCAILSPLSAAHRAGIVHRDLKPDNVFLVRQSRGEMVKLLDFGISRTAGHDAEFRLTTTGLVLGTPYYMSPEQARGDSAITPASDLYAFGVMLYEMLVGHVPIQADNYNQLMYRVMMGDFPRPREHRADLPEPLEQLILQAMALAAEDRPASALELEHALLEHCRPAFRDHAGSRLSAPGLPFTALPSSLRTGPGASASGSDRTGLADSAADDLRHAPTRPDARVVPRRPRWPMRAGVVILLGGAAALAAFVLGRSDGAPPTPTAASPTTAATSPSSAAASPSSAAASPSAAAASPPAAAASPTAAAASPTTAAASPPTAATSPPSAAASPPAAAASPTPPAAPEPATITLRFAIEPLDASITLDGAPVRGSELAVPRDAADHTVRITAPGHAAHDAIVRFDESQRLTVQLRRLTAPVRGKPRKDRSDRIDSQSPYD